MSLSSRFCTRRKSGRAFTATTQIMPNTRGSKASIRSASRALVRTNITVLPIIHNGARVSIRRDICTIICTMLMSLVARTSKLPVCKRSRLPKEKVCTLRTRALRRSAPALWATRTEATVLPTANNALRIAAPSINSAVVTMAPRSCWRMPSSMTRWVRRGIARSATTTPAISSRDRILSPA